MTTVVCPTCGGGSATKMSGNTYACASCMSTFDLMDALRAAFASGNTPGRMQMPDELGEVIGFRAWHIIDTSEGVRLASTGYGGAHSRQVWIPGDVNHAICDKAHTPADLHCSCGFYAAVSREHLLSLNTYHLYDKGNRVVPVAIGQVMMDGQVVVATLGWRGENAWPISVLVPHLFWKYATPLAAEYGPYGVEVRLDNTLVMPKSKGPKWCTKCGAKLKDRTPKCHLCGTLVGD